MYILSILFTHATFSLFENFVLITNPTYKKRYCLGVLIQKSTILTSDECYSLVNSKEVKYYIYDRRTENKIKINEGITIYNFRELQINQLVYHPKFDKFKDTSKNLK